MATGNLLYRQGASAALSGDLEGWDGGGREVQREKIYVYTQMIHVTYNRS